MHTATILPQHFLDMIQDEPYLMALGNLIGAPGFENYTQFYAWAGKDPNKFVMLDTGLIEGNARPVEELLEKAKAIYADEMALNDIFMDHTATLKESWNALQYIKSQGDDHPRLMAIPQGTSLEDWIACAKEMLTWDIDTIGIPKVLTKLEGRDARLHAIIALEEFIGDKHIHLLGCWDTPLELKVIENATRAGTISAVRGCDSAIAYAYARSGLKITEAARPEGEINFGAMNCDLALLRYNIDVWKEEAMTLPPLDGGDTPKIYRIK